MFIYIYSIRFDRKSVRRKYSSHLTLLSSLPLAVVKMLAIADALTPLLGMRSVHVLSSKHIYRSLYVSAGRYGDVIVQFGQGVILPGGFEIDMGSAGISLFGTLNMHHI